MLCGSFFFAVPWVCLRFVVVVIPDHTHLLFLVNPIIGGYLSLKDKIRFSLKEIDHAPCISQEEM